MQLQQNAKEIAIRIRDLAKERNVTIKEVLSECGIGGSWLSDVERREKFPTADRLLMVALYFDVSVDYLLGRSPPQLTETDLTENERQLVELYRQLSFVSQAEAVVNIKNLKEKEENNG